MDVTCVVMVRVRVRVRARVRVMVIGLGLKLGLGKGKGLEWTRYRVGLHDGGVRRPLFGSVTRLVDDLHLHLVGVGVSLGVGVGAGVMARAWVQMAWVQVGGRVNVWG